MNGSPGPHVLVDETHCGRHVTGLERITLELFSQDALAPLPIVPVRAGRRWSMIGQQVYGLPSRLLMDRSALVLCPGFPPSVPLTLVGGDRVVPYIHDMFLLTRPQDLNRRASLYMVAPFRLAVTRGTLFLVNSETTAAELRRFCRPDAEIVLYRPRVRDVFDASSQGRSSAVRTPKALRLLAMGTVEPRKNLFAAAAILSALRSGSHSEATLDIVGRAGWGVDVEALSAIPGVTMHGYQSAEAVRTLMAESDALISTSHDEGLGLPLLEAQYAGLAVIAPRKPVFQEVLGSSGVLIEPSNAGGAAAAIAAAVAEPSWRDRQAAQAAANLRRWNHAAALDRERVIDRLHKLLWRTSNREARQSV